MSSARLNAAGIILAGGESRRMGRPKAFLPFRGGTFLSVLAGTLQTSCSSVVAVFGFDGENIRQFAPASVATVVNPRYEFGMLTSLQTGLQAVLQPPESTFDAVLFTLVDHPAVKPATVALLAASEAEIAIPRFDGKRGHPVLVRREIALEYLAEPVTSKVRDVIDRHNEKIRYIEVDDPGICDDVDDPVRYAALLAREARL